MITCFRSFWESRRTNPAGETVDLEQVAATTREGSKPWANTLLRVDVAGSELDCGDEFSWYFNHRDSYKRMAGNQGGSCYEVRNKKVK